MRYAWRVVVADDYPDVADSLALALDTYGCTPYTAHDGTTALELIRKYSPHAALLELALPGMTGSDVACAVRRDPRTMGTVMITVTAWSRNSDRLHALLNGFDAYVLKPANVSDLLRLIASNLERRDSLSTIDSQGGKENHGRQEADAIDMAKDRELPHVVTHSGRTSRR